MSDSTFFDSVREAADKHAEALFGDKTWNDAAFLVEKGAEKKPDATTNNQYLQKYRHLVHHEKTATDPNANDTVNLSHLRNALARQNQVQPLIEDAAGFHSRAKSHLEKHAKALLKTYQKASANLKEIEDLCAEFNIITADELDAAGANTKVVKNGAADKPYCVIGASGHNFGCYPTTQEAQKRSDQINNFGKK